MSQQGSFIPKSPINSKVSTKRVRKIYVLTYLVYVLFFGTLIAAGATWFYTYSLNQDLVQKQTELEDAEDAFVQSDLERVAELESRLEIAQDLLDSRVSMNKVLAAIEETTATNVLMSGFEYGVSESNTLQLAMVANSENFNDALFQRSLLQDNPVLRGSSIINVKYGGGGGASESVPGTKEVSFTIEKRLDSATRNAVMVTATGDINTSLEDVDSTDTTSSIEGVPAEATNNDLGI